MIQAKYWKRPLAMLAVAVLLLCCVPVCMPAQAAAASPIEAIGKPSSAFVSLNSLTL